MSAARELFTLAQGRFLRLVRAGHWEYADRINATGAAVVVAVTEDSKLLLVEQYRIPCGKQVIELPAGIVGDEPDRATEALAEAARRELLEETGYEAGAMELIMTGPSSAGLTSELVSIFIAKQLRRVGKGGGEGNEKITVHEVPLDQIDQWLNEQMGQDRLVDPKVFAGLYFLSQ